MGIFDLSKLGIGGNKKLGREVHMKMSLVALHKVGRFIVDHPQIKVGDNFKIEGTDGSNLIIHIS